jgi:hypothetical protein
MPSPEQLGLTSAGPVAEGLDWAAVHKRLGHLGATCIHLEKRETGNWGFTCLLPTGQAGKTYRIDAEAENEALAVQLALDRADKWVRNNR